MVREWKGRTLEEQNGKRGADQAEDHGTWNGLAAVPHLFTHRRRTLEPATRKPGVLVLTALHARWARSVRTRRR